MAKVFGALAILSSGLLVTAIGLGLLGSSQHLMWGLGAAVFAVSIHCLIFAIFTGSGKDTRLLVEDLGLNAEFVKKTKVFKRTIFPPALYAIFFLLISTTLGGALSLKGSPWLGWAHGIWASFTVYYNLKIFWKEYLAVKENGQILAKVNSTAGEVLHGQLPEATEFTPGNIPEKVADLDWGTHVYAFGKFLGFLAWNVWLVYLYFRFIMAEIRTPFLPFLVGSASLWLAGYYLRFRYHDFRPKFGDSTSHY